MNAEINQIFEDNILKLTKTQDYSKEDVEQKLNEVTKIHSILKEHQVELLPLEQIKIEGNYYMNGIMNHIINEWINSIIIYYLNYYFCNI